MNGEFAIESWERLQVFLGDRCDDMFTFSRLSQCHATSLETGTTETTAIDAICMSHDFIESLQFWRTCFPVVDA